jgi:hypothetical protein
MIEALMLKEEMKRVHAWYTLANGILEGVSLFCSLLPLLASFSATLQSSKGLLSEKRLGLMMALLFV